MIDPGCFGHVCPPWFATKFPVVSASNVEAVAANDVALQHYGQKVVYGHVTTTSGRHVLIHITFDMMSVCKPLLSTSALKRRGVAIIFSHDYDRIIFRNETVNLVSHESHSYLRVTMTSGVPHRKAMVMTRENVSMDVDEEEYAADGDEMPEAREALDGDRRAVADADQAGQLAISGETKTPRALLTPEPPTDAARMLHYTTLTYQAEIGSHSAWQVAQEVLRTDELWRTSQRTLWRSSRQTACSCVQWLRAKRSHASHWWKRAVEQ